MADTAKWWVISGLLVFSVLLYLLSPIIAPFLTAAVFAYLGDPLVNRLVALKIPRTLAAIIVFLIMLLFILLLLLLLIPLLQQQLVILSTKLPIAVLWLQESALPWLQQQVGMPFQIPDLKTVITQHWQQVGDIAATLWHAIAKSGLALVAWLVNMLIVAVVTFYLLRDWDGVIENARALLPRSVEPLVLRLFNECNQVLSAFFRGQLLVMLALAIIYSGGLWLVGLDLALLIGVIAGVVSVVPYLGMIVGVGIATIATLMQFHDGVHLLYVWLVFAVGHLIENLLLTPLLIGNRIGLHPVTVIFAVLAGGQLFGFTGILLALPIAAVCMVLIRYFKERYLRSGFYGNSPGAR